MCTIQIYDKSLCIIIGKQISNLKQVIYFIYNKPLVAIELEFCSQYNILNYTSFLVKNNIMTNNCINTNVYKISFKQIVVYLLHHNILLKLY